MSLAERRDALARWDQEVIDSYLARLAGTAPPLRSCPITLQTRCARDLVMVSADLAVRSASRLGDALATLDNAVLRDAALGIAIARYVAILPSPTRQAGDNAIAERILASLVLRFDAARGEAAALTRLTISLPAEPYDALVEEVARVLAGTDLVDLGDYRDALEPDVRSSVIEAIAFEWMHQRSRALGVRLGRDAPAHRPAASVRQPRRGRQR